MVVVDISLAAHWWRLDKPHILTMSSKGEVRRGVCHAWVKHQPAPLGRPVPIQSFGSTPGVCLCTRLVQPPWTMVGWCLLGLKYTKHFGPFFYLLCVMELFPQGFWGQFNASDWAAMSCVIQVSCQVSSFFSCRNCMCAHEICSSRVCCVYSPSCGTVGRPAFLACVCNIGRPTLPPHSLFKRLFQNIILLMATVILGHHWTCPHLSFWHWFSVTHFVAVTAWSMVLSSIWYWRQRSDGFCRMVFKSTSYCGRFCVVSSAHKALLYQVITWRSLHCKCHAGGWVNASWLCGHTCSMSKSTQRLPAWWSLGTASCCPFKELWWCKILSIGLLPLWKVGVHLQYLATWVLWPDQVYWPRHGLGWIECHHYSLLTTVLDLHCLATFEFPLQYWLR